MRYASRTGNAASVATDCLVLPRRAAREAAAAMGVAEQVDLVLNGTKGKAGGVARMSDPSKVSEIVDALFTLGGQGATAADDRTALVLRI